jgi:hypothetical protein
MKAATKTTFTFSQEDIMMILSDHVNREHGVDTTPDMFKADIEDSYTGGFDLHDGPSTPARIRGISVTVDG